MSRKRNHVYLFCAFIAICTSAIMASAWGVDPLAIILILFGMSFGTVFTLFIVPVVYLLLSGKHAAVAAEAPAADEGIAGAAPVAGT